MEWISCKDRLPDKNAKEFRYLVAYWLRSLDGSPLERIVDIAGFGAVRNDHADCKEGWRWEIHFYELGMLVPCNCWIPDEQVTHWMPLPTKPRIPAKDPK